jgi:pteridine reductase
VPAAIVNIADWRGLKPLPGHFSYTLTKAALIAMTRILAIELAPDIRVNAVAPGSILPPPGAGPDYLEHLAKQVPLKRHGDPSDVTSAVLYLLRSDFVTGEVIAVTGGEQLQ